MAYRPSLLCGRFQPLTANHVALIRQLLAEGKNVVVGIYDTEKDERNPYTLLEREKMIQQAFGGEVAILHLPHIGEFVYGRDVGYGIRELTLDVELPQISGTTVREAFESLPQHGWQATEPTPPEKPTSFVEHFNRVAAEQYQDMRQQGFWGPLNECPDRNDGEAIALIHSELTEVLECLRNGNPPDKDLPEFSGAEVQMADVLGRVMDLSSCRGWRIAKALLAKMKHNRTRPHKHGKAF